MAEGASRCRPAATVLLAGARARAAAGGEVPLDVIVPDGSGSQNLVWLANPRPAGSPASAPWTRRVIGTVGGSGKDVEPADFDGDGRLDVATRSNAEAMGRPARGAGPRSRPVPSAPSTPLAHAGSRAPRGPCPRTSWSRSRRRPGT